MLAHSLFCAVFFGALFVPVHGADPGAGSVIVESTLARKKEHPEHGEHQDRIWSAVIMATNAPAPKAPPIELAGYETKLKRVFGYNQFNVVGSSTELIDEENERWLVPSQSFSLSVRARRATSKEARGGYLLNLQLFQDKRPLVATEVKLAPGSPLFFRGPECGKGQIIFVLQVQEAKH